jgi:hypothetical protein
LDRDCRNRIDLKGKKIMKTRNRTTKLLAITLALGVLAAVCAIWGARPAQAIIITGGKTGLFGITGGQTVRISTVNLAQNRGGIVPCFGVFDIAGNKIAGHEMGAPLPVGQGTFFDWDASGLGLRQRQRAQIRVEVELEPAPGATGRMARIQPGDAIVTVEVFDNETGKTTFTIPLTLSGFNPLASGPGDEVPPATGR